MSSQSLKALLPIPIENVPDIRILSMTLNSQAVRPGALFIAIQGAKFDGREFIAEAIQHGASAVLCSGDAAAISYQHTIPIITLPNLQSQVGYIADRFYSHPSHELVVIGVTGTNGKTTTAHMLAECLSLLGVPAASIGTLGLKFKSIYHDFGLTTPDAINLQRSLAELRDAGAKAVVMEVSSHALDQGRVNGICFSGAMFTNLTQDHLDYHHSMDEYLKAKIKLFTTSQLKFAVVNRDDNASESVISALKPDVTCYHYYLKTNCPEGAQHHLTASDSNIQGPISFTVQHGGKRAFIQTQFMGEFNISNVLGVIGALVGLGISLDAIAKVLPQVSAAPGRMQGLGGGLHPYIIVDYAHTPDALEKALLAARAHSVGTLWCVFGCGGDRDTGKRAMMGRVASELADKVILTNDNPRTESPSNIVAGIMQGIAPEMHNKVKIEFDRKQAILSAISEAKATDVILVAGKGHEDYQITGTEKHSFSDAECIKSILNEDSNVTVTNR